MMRMHNTHKCSTSVNGCKKDINAECKRGYSRSEYVLETFVNKVTNRVVYRRRTKNDLLIVPYNLQMMMDWDSHKNVEYSGLAYFALYLYKYCYKGAARRERIDLSPEQEHDSQDEIKLFIYREDHVFYGRSLENVWISGLSSTRSTSLCFQGLHWRSIGGL